MSGTGGGKGTAGSRRLAAAAALILAAGLAGLTRAEPATAQDRPRLREAGVEIGHLPPGPLNAITDVDGVRVGHETVRGGDSIRTGVTAVLPHGGNLFREKVPAAAAVGNGFGKLVGTTQINELGEIETPILLTATLSVFRAADALVDTMLAIPENASVRSINPVVGETNDGFLSDIRQRPIEPRHVRSALRSAGAGAVEEGSVGAGTGTTALGWKGGVGTASRVVEADGESYTVGVLTQTNYGGRLRVDGVPVAGQLDQGGISRRSGGATEEGEPAADPPPADGASPGEGSVMIVVATDAPLAHRELTRVADRAFLGISRTGSYMSHGSGDYALAFSTDRESRRLTDGGLMSSLFEATVEATEEAALNSLFAATTVRGHRGTARALPVDRVLEIMRSHGRDAGRR